MNKRCDDDDDDIGLISLFSVSINLFYLNLTDRLSCIYFRSFLNIKTKDFEKWKLENFGHTFPSLTFIKLIKFTFLSLLHLLIYVYLIDLIINSMKWSHNFVAFVVSFSRSVVIERESFSYHDDDDGRIYLSNVDGGHFWVSMTTNDIRIKNDLYHSLTHTVI